MSSFEISKPDELIEKLKGIDVNLLTPMEAMNQLFELSKEAKKRG